MRCDCFLDELTPVELRRLARVALLIAAEHGFEVDGRSVLLCNVGLLVAEEKLIARSFCRCDRRPQPEAVREFSVRVDS